MVGEMECSPPPATAQVGEGKGEAQAVEFVVRSLMGLAHHARSSHHGARGRGRGGFSHKGSHSVVVRQEGSDSSSELIITRVAADGGEDLRVG